MLRIKDDSVKIVNYTPAIMSMLNALFLYADEVKYDITITCGREAHKAGSHPKDKALDVRSKNFPSGQKKYDFMNWMKTILGPSFTVLLENEGKQNEHFHIQVKIGAKYP